MTDRELLELAAKAAGLNGLEWSEVLGCLARKDDLGRGFDLITRWEPLTDDGDALRLAVKLGISIYPNNGNASTAEWECSVEGKETHYCANTVVHNDDPCGATRRAIVRAAAEIGKEMK